MKKFFAVLFLLLFMFVPSALAATPDITSDSQSFNILTGVYDLKGNVRVDLGERIIEGDAAQVYMYSLEVKAQGNIRLTDTDSNIHFDCDSVHVKGSERTAYVNGNMQFTQDDLRITADSGSFNWKTKNAVFSGNVTVNGQPQQGDVTYNVRSKEFI